MAEEQAGPPAASQVARMLETRWLRSKGQHGCSAAHFMVVVCRDKCRETGTPSRAHTFFICRCHRRVERSGLLGHSTAQRSTARLLGQKACHSEASATEPMHCQASHRNCSRSARLLLLGDVVASTVVVGSARVVGALGDASACSRQGVACRRVRAASPGLVCSIAGKTM